MPTMEGSLLAVNAIPDAMLVVDSPPCILMKTERIHGNHDWLSDLLHPLRPRVVTTNIHYARLSAGDTAPLERALRRGAELPGVGAVFLLPISFVSIVPQEYELVVEEVLGDRKVPVIILRSRELHGDWLDGYADILDALARSLPLPSRRGPSHPEAVAVVGPLLDRTEADQEANLVELRALLGSLGLETVTIWPSGRPVADLARVVEASHVISLPYARAAARTLADRIGAGLVEAPLPVGLERTARFLETVGRAVGRPERAAAAIAAGERAVLPKLCWPLRRWFQDRGFALLSDPHLVPGLTDALTFLGARPERLYVNTRRQHDTAELQAALPIPAVFEPKADRVEAELQASRTELSLAIGDTFFCGLARDAGVAFLEFGFPSYFSHELVGRPWYGYRGFLGLAERFANALARAEFGAGDA
jgi:nitrogenase molybdenum-iron protein alpha/beta subunit